MTASPSASVLTAFQDGVLTVTLNRPQRKNAIDGSTWEELRRTFDDASRDDRIRALVLTGAGGDFCAGADVSDIGGDEHPMTMMRRINAAILALHDLPIPTVAAVSGVAVGGGWNLALGCDLVVAAHSARFSQIFAQRGLSVDCGGAWLLPRIVGLQQAKRLVMLAEMISAQEAVKLGMITYLVDDADLQGTVAEVAARLAAGPPVALAQSKALLNEATGSTFPESLAGEARAQTVNFGGTDAPAAFEAFLARRTPEFTGGWGSAEPGSR
jgi:enoyl-CoA hydratase/carnithine racemase